MLKKAAANGRIAARKNGLNEAQTRAHVGCHAEAWENRPQQAPASDPTTLVVSVQEPYAHASAELAAYVYVHLRTHAQNLRLPYLQLCSQARVQHMCVRSHLCA